MPFNFDVHALHFSEDAVGVEAECTQALAEKRVNRVNLRREFFYTSPSEVRELLGSVAETSSVRRGPEAAEYRQARGRLKKGSERIRTGASVSCAMKRPVVWTDQVVFRARCDEGCGMCRDRSPSLV